MVVSWGEGESYSLSVSPDSNLAGGAMFVIVREDRKMARLEREVTEMQGV